MEQTQPLKKRIVEMASSSPPDSNQQRPTQRTSRIRKYRQFVPIAAIKALPIPPPIPMPPHIQILRQKRAEERKSQGQVELPKLEEVQAPSQPQAEQQKQCSTQEEKPRPSPSHEPGLPQKQPSPTHEPEQSQTMPQKSFSTLDQRQAKPQNKNHAQSKPMVHTQVQTQPKLVLHTDVRTPSQSQPKTPPPIQLPNPPQTQQRPQFITLPQPQLQMQLDAHLQNQLQTHNSTQQSFCTLIDVQNQQQTTENGIQIIEHIYKEPPMMLNAWTQTTSEDLENADKLMGEMRPSVLLTEIERLKEALRESYDYINSNLNVTGDSVIEEEDGQLAPAVPRTSSPQSPQSQQSVQSPQLSTPETALSQLQPSPSPVKTETQTYRILSQGDDPNCDENIEIELSMVETDEVNNENTPPKVYKIIKSEEPTTSNAANIEEYPRPYCAKPIPMESGVEYVTIGTNKTHVPMREFNKIPWNSASIATRKLLTLVFSREVLATHSMTGKASPAFKDLAKPVKGRLDPDAVQDIIEIVSAKCSVSSKEVRSAITTKCADENKMLKLKGAKRMSEENTKQRPILGELRPRNSPGTSNSQANKRNGK